MGVSTRYIVPQGADSPNGNGNGHGHGARDDRARRTPLAQTCRDMQERTRRNFELFNRLLPAEVDVYLRDEKGHVAVYVTMPREELRRDIDHAYELVMAESRYQPGFDLFTVTPRHLTRGAVKPLLDSAAHIQR